MGSRREDTEEPDPEWELLVAHTKRFRRVSNAYPRIVTKAYGGNLELAAAESDEQVAATVATWKSAQGREPRDWLAIGAAERGEIELDDGEWH